MVGAADSVLIREVSLIQSVFYREALLYSFQSKRFDSLPMTLSMSNVCNLYNV